MRKLRLRGCLRLSRDRGRSIVNWRKFASHAFGMLILLFGISCSLAGEEPVQPEPIYRLRLYHTHTNERIDVVYRVGDNYISSAIDQLDQFLRDHRTGDVIQLDRRVFDLLHDLTVAVGRPEAEIDIICGYRTPWSNEFLRRTTRVSHRIACICRERPSISACRASPSRNCETSHSPFIVEESATIRSRALFTWMSAGFAAGKFLLLLRSSAPIAWGTSSPRLVPDPHPGRRCRQRNAAPRLPIPPQCCTRISTGMGSFSLTCIVSSPFIAARMLSSFHSGMP